MRLFAVFIFIFIFSLISCQTETNNQTKAAVQEGAEETNTISNWQLTTSEGINIHHPENWEVDLTGFMGSKFLLYFPEKEGDAFRENIILITQTVPESSATLEAFGKSTVDQLKSFVTDAKILDSGMSENKDYFHCSYTGKQGSINLNWYQRIYLKGNTAYILTFTADPADYESNKSIATNSMDSFKFP